MPAILASILRWVIVSSVARVFAGIGLAVVSQAFLGQYANDALQSMTNAITGMNSDVGNMFKLLGIGQFLSIVGAAIITRVSIVQSAKIFGINLE